MSNTVTVSAIAGNNNITNSTNRNRRELSLNFSEGSVITATITDKVRNKYILTTDDNISFQADESKLKGKIGDRLFFEVTKNSEGVVSLKQLSAPYTMEQGAEAFLSTDSIKELFEKSGFIKEDNIFKKEYVEEQVKMAQALGAIRRKLQYASANLTENAVGWLTGAGISLTKIDLDMLTTTIKELKETPEADKNKKFLTAVHNKLEEIKQLDKGAVVLLLKEGSELTIENIYIAKHSAVGLFRAGEGKAENKLSDRQWDGLKGEINKIFKLEGIENNEKTREFARLMIESGVDITKENMDKAIFLSDIAANLTDDSVISKAMQNIIMDKSLLDIDLYELYTGEKNLEIIMEKVQSVMDILPKLSDRDIEFLLKRQIPVTISALKRANEGTFNQAETLPAELTASESSKYTKDFITTKRQLIELQLKLTHQSAAALYKNGIQIDTLSLEQALAELKNLEQQQYAASLKVVGAESSNENIGKMEDLYTMLKDSMPVTNNAYASFIERPSLFNIEALHKAVSAARALKDLETFATVVNPKYADSFAKVRNELAPFVEGLGLEVTNQNIKAASILSKNELDVTIENIMKVKAIDAKINTIYDRLHPTIAASMIKDGLNPSKLHVDEIISYIDSFDKQYGEQLSEKIPEFIAEMDKDKTLTADERNSMIAIYRMLNTIRKNDSAALGFALKNDVDLTLGSMLEAAKYFSRTKGKANDINYTVSDEEGAVADVIATDKNIKAILSKTEKKEAIDYFTAISKQFENNAHPFSLKQLIKENGLLDDLPFEELNGLLAEVKAELQEEIKGWEIKNNMTKLAEYLKSSPSTVQFMEQNNIPLTMVNMGIMQMLIKNPYFVGERLDSLTKDDNITSEDKQSLLDSLLDTSLDKLMDGKSAEGVIKDINESLENIAENTAENISENAAASRLLKELNLIQNAIKVQSFTERSDSYAFKLPVALHDKIASLNMYILNDNLDGNETSLLISINTNGLGNVNIHADILGDGVSMKINADSKEALKFLKENEGLLELFAGDAGYRLTGTQFTDDKGILL